MDSILSYASHTALFLVFKLAHRSRHIVTFLKYRGKSLQFRKVESSILVSDTCAHVLLILDNDLC